MAFVLKDRVRETSITTGTGVFTLAGAVLGYQAFSAVMTSPSDTCWYAIVLSATSWETGLGTYSGANTLTRTTVLESSNANSLVNFGAGIKDVFIGIPASKMLGIADSTGGVDAIRFNTAQSLTSAQKLIALANVMPDNSTGGFSAGDFKFTLKTVADPTWVMADDGTIGDATSGATTRANADTFPLYSILWNIAIAYTPIFTSAGAGSVRGANAAADFAAHKRIAITKALGRAMAAAGAGRSLGEYAGADTPSISIANLPVHTPTVASYNLTYTSATADSVAVPDSPAVVPVTRSFATSGGTPVGGSITMNPIGSGTAFSVVQLSVYVNVMLKL